MTSGDEPQLGGQDRDNAPMISGRGTQIIVSVRGAYEARNLAALFAAMEEPQQIAFRQAVVRELLVHIRAEVEQAAETQPNLLDTLRSLDLWLNSPMTPIAEGVTPETYDTRFRDLSPIEGRLRGLVVASVFPGQNAITYAIDAMSYDEPPRQPYWLILQGEIKDWVFEAGWAILHGRGTPPLNLDAGRIESLIEDVAGWHRKRNLPVLVMLMTDDQRIQFKQAVRQQALWCVDHVPASLWSDEYLHLFAYARGWLADPSTLTEESLRAARKPFKGEGLLSPLRSLVQVFVGRDEDLYPLIVPYASSALSLVRQVIRKLEGTPAVPSNHPMLMQAEQWQLDAAYAILTDQPLPPLGDLNDGR